MVLRHDQLAEVDLLAGLVFLHELTQFLVAVYHFLVLLFQALVGEAEPLALLEVLQMGVPQCGKHGLRFLNKLLRGSRIVHQRLASGRALCS